MRLGFIVYLVSLSLVVCGKAQEEAPLACLESTGTCYQGGWYPTSSGKKFAAFQGIRFAQAPLGNLRFKAPKPLDEITIGTIDVSQESDIKCLQNGGEKGQEDCLFLNVYIPEMIYS